MGSIRNPSRLVLNLARRFVTAVTSFRSKRIVVAAAICGVALLIGAGVYTITAPLQFARDLAASLLGGAPHLPPARAACIPESAAVQSGRYTPAAQSAISEIPSNTGITAATAYLIYRWGHPADDWQPTWDQWTITLAERQVSDTAGDVDTALTIDPTTDYTPYLVPARATTVGLAINGPIVADKRQLAELADQIYRTCRTATEPESRQRQYTEIASPPTTPDTTYEESPR